jgi:branched-chain amino acid transport system permease protein
MWDNIMVLNAAPIFNVQLILNGILVGAVFALAAYGLALVWGVMNVKNLAQGDFVMMGGYCAYLFAQYGLHPVAALLPAVIIMFVFGWVIYRVIMSSWRREKVVRSPVPCTSTSWPPAVATTLKSTSAA